MNQLTCAEVVHLQEHLRACINLTHICDHFANETADPQIKNFCSQIRQQHQQGYERLTRFLGSTQAH